MTRTSSGMEKPLCQAPRRLAGWLIEQMLTAGYMEKGRLFPNPQGGVLSPLWSNILLTPFDREMRRRGYRLTRYAGSWVRTCQSRREAEVALRSAAVRGFGCQRRRSGPGCAAGIFRRTRRSSRSTGLRRRFAGRRGGASRFVPRR